MAARYNPLHWLGIVLAWGFLAVVIIPMIAFFIMAALMEVASTGNWRQANEKSADMGKSLERPIWWLQSLGGLLQIAPPDH